MIIKRKGEREAERQGDREGEWEKRRYGDRKGGIGKGKERR